MINALSPSWIVRVLSLVVLVLAGGSLFLGADSGQADNPGQVFADLWTHSGLIVSIMSALVLALTIRPVLRVFHFLTLGEHWWFPWLDGKWDGEINSNWPIVWVMMESAKRNRGQFDSLTDPLPPDAPSAVHKLDVEIKSGLFHFEVYVKVLNTRRTSRTFFARPRWTRPDPPMLYYVYQQEDLDQPAPTDARTHLGAAVLTLTSDGELRGEYWTQRRGDRGLNTAGTLILKRKSRA